MSTKTRLGLATGISVFALAPIAMALTIIGTKGDDRIVGSRSNDRIAALAGNDKVRALGGDDRVQAGPGDDGVAGEGGADFIQGKSGNDSIRAGNGDDHARAGVGVDVVSGGSGGDVLWAFAKQDIAADGVDTLVGGHGNDLFRARDGEADQIDCGHGRRDRAILDLADVIVDATPLDPNGSCEKVDRAEPKPSDPAAE